MSTLIVKNVSNNQVRDENYWMTILIYFSAFLIGLGIVAEVAYNWELIPNNFKLWGAIASMLINAVAIIWTMHADKPVLKQVLTCVYAFLIMGVIGLIGQVFQLKSDFIRGCLAWSALSWPLFLVAPRMLWLWLPMALIGVDGTITGYDSWTDDLSRELGMNGSWQAPVRHVPYIMTLFFYLGLIGAYELWVNFKKEPKDNIIANPLRFWSAWTLLIVYGSVVYSVSFCNKLDASLVQHELLLAFAKITPFIGLALLVWMLNVRYERKSLMPLFLLGLLVEFGLALAVMPYFSSFQYRAEAGLPIVFILLMTMYARNHNMRRLIKLCYLAIIAWFIAVWNDDIFDLIPSLIACSLLAAWAYRVKNKRWFNIAILAAVLRILGHYADVENLQFFGLYLIGSGILLLTTLLMLKKYGKILWENKDEK